MRHILFAAVWLGSVVLISPAYAAEQTVTMDIEKMSCALCPLTVRTAMEGVDGVQEVEVDFDAKSATVTFDDDKTTVEEVAQASTDVGYPATPTKE